MNSRKMSVWSFKIAKFSTKMILLLVNVARTWRTSSTSGGPSWPVTNHDDPWQDVTKTSTNTYLVFSSSVMNSTPPNIPLYLSHPNFSKKRKHPPICEQHFFEFFVFCQLKKIVFKEIQLCKENTWHQIYKIAMMCLF